MKTTSLSETNSLAEQVQRLLATVECLRNEVSELRQENSDLQQQVRELQCEVGYPQQKAWALKWLSRIRELYQLNRSRINHPPGSPEFAAADAKLREQVEVMATERGAELSLATLHCACRKVLRSLSEHWTGLALFVDDPVIPMDNN